MPIQYASGLPYPRVSDPPTVYTANDRGLYPWSAFRALFGYANNGDILRTASGSTSDILLFTSDIPAMVTAAGSLSNVVTQYTLLSNSLTTSILAPTSGGAAGVSASAYGQVFKGYAGASFNVPCSGFAVTNTFTFATGESTNSLDCLANSNSIISPIGNNNLQTGSGATPVSQGVSPIILLNTDYTQEILDNNNIVLVYNRAFLVVGLYRAN